VRSVIEGNDAFIIVTDDGRFGAVCVDRGYERGEESVSWSRSELRWTFLHRYGVLTDEDVNDVKVLAEKIEAEEQRIRCEQNVKDIAQKARESAEFREELLRELNHGDAADE
jgi:hypothetical protein